MRQKMLVIDQDKNLITYDGIGKSMRQKVLIIDQHKSFIIWCNGSLFIGQVSQHSISIITLVMSSYRTSCDTIHRLHLEKVTITKHVTSGLFMGANTHKLTVTSKQAETSYSCHQKQQFCSFVLSNWRADSQLMTVGPRSSYQRNINYNKTHLSCFNMLTYRTPIERLSTYGTPSCPYFCGIASSTK